MRAHVRHGQINVDYGTILAAQHVVVARLAAHKSLGRGLWHLILDANRPIRRPRFQNHLTGGCVVRAFGILSFDFPAEITRANHRSPSRRVHSPLNRWDEQNLWRRRIKLTDCTALAWTIQTERHSPRSEILDEALSRSVDRVWPVRIPFGQAKIAMAGLKESQFRHDFLCSIPPASCARGRLGTRS